jgi:hypothetical protein
MRALIILLLVGIAGTAHAQSAELKLGEKPHADLPFTVQLQVEGFDDTPAPELPKLEIPGAQVTSLGWQPSSSRSITIINGRRVDDARVTWVMSWRLVVPKAGPLKIPSITVKQGSKTATARGGDVQVDSVPQTQDMKVQLQLPERPIFVGETVPVKLMWMFRAQPEDQTFSVPLANLDALTVSGPPVPQGARRTIEIAAGAKELQLPFDIDKVTQDGLEYTRLTAMFYIAPRSIPTGGKLEIAPTSVVAALQVGRRDFFGNAASKLFRASDTARTLEIKPLPETDRPPVFAGAVGEQFSIDVRTSRSVVSLGEPVELDISIKSDQRLDALSLGKLDGPGRLPKDKFTAPSESPTGELSADGKTKTFKVVAQVTGPANEIPALAFAYFDPKLAKYQTILSQPIALSVKGGTVVGANDVVVGTRKTTQQVTEDTALVNADLALSSTGAAESTPLGGSLLWFLVGALYAIPLAILGFRSWQLRTAESREEAGEVRAARKQVEQLLDRSATAPAREIAGPLVAALRELGRVLGRSIDDKGLLARIETESFAPAAANQPLSPDLRSDAAGLLRRWLGEERKTRGSKTAAAALVFVAVFAADEARADSLSDGRAAYQYAMELTGDATGRKAAFARAAVALGEAAREHPDRPELLADWGNAALGAGEVGTATLAYRRALALDPSNTRARHNLAWLRGRLPERMQPKVVAGATDTLLFFHRWPRARRLVVGGVAFAISILLLVPWRGRARRRGGMVALAALALAVWLAMLASVILEDRHTDDAVVIDSITLRAADSAGAPAALTEPLPRGVEVEILERRDSWTRIALSSGTTGWVPDGAVERVVRP